ncbi:S-layer homology domain-containing protein [Marinitoga sp. 38H-ov]|uniref:S-layer homology domain-containing protein n=1 Tax=Marinitoga sp. 38H-ov TaxID=1755814 RepID=UPI0013ED41D2|nr:S-layer homology domain-containing protein [Marinitoga sp. 38H-ov]KAF2956501.1 hypothetical protein AS160_05590 [Marinitoga sp. 38H-ov]
MKKLLLILTVLALAVFSFAATTYKDVPVNHWAFDSIERLSSLGIIEGFPDGTYQGLSQVNRYQLTVALDRALKYVEQQLFATLAEKVVSIDKQLQELSKKSSGLTKAEVENIIKDSMSNFDAGDLNNRIKELENSINELKTAYEVISFLSTKVDSLSNLETRIANLENNLSTLKELSTELSSLKSEVATNKAALESIGVLANKVASLETKINSINFDSQLASLESKKADKTDLEAYAKISDLNTLSGKLSNLENLTLSNSDKIKLLESNLNNFVTKSDLQEFVTFGSLNNELKNYALKSDLSGLVKDSQLNDYVTKSDLEAQLANYATSDSIVDSARVNKIEKTANQANILSWLGVLLGIAGITIYFINPSNY